MAPTYDLPGRKEETRLTRFREYRSFDMLLPYKTDDPVAIALLEEAGCEVVEKAPKAHAAPVAPPVPDVDANDNEKKEVEQ